MQSNKESNQKLIERFPFLIPRNRWTGKIPEDYDYSYTELDSMPDGWRKAFGEQMCEDIREELVRAEYLDQYRITQIKEKYGTLCWYDFWPHAGRSRGAVLQILCRPKDTGSCD